MWTTPDLQSGDAAEKGIVDKKLFFFSINCAMIMNKKVHCQICFGFGQSRDAVMPKGNTIGKYYANDNILMKYIDMICYKLNTW